MNLPRRETTWRRISTGIFFCSCYLYFIVLNRYILIFQEQNQFFLFNGNYFAESLERPGGPLEYSGAFLTQFFLFPVAGALILTLAGTVIFLTTGYIFRKHRITGIFFSFVPVLLLASLHNNYLYTISYTLGLIVSLGYFALYISAGNNKLRYYYIICGLPLLYFISGGYVLLSVLLCLVNELLYSRGPSMFLKAALLILFAVLVPYLASQFIFYIEPGRSWTIFLPFFINAPVKYVLVLLLVYFPLVLIFCKVWMSYAMRDLPEPGRNIKTLIAGTLFIVCIAGILLKFVYDKRTEILLGMDNCIQRSDWDGALKLSSSYPDTNRLVMYFTNLALYKTGHMGDQMFHYPQAGTSGLWLEWKLDGATAFFGGEIYYQLAYTNEANRWAFEAMVAKGLNPRSLKRLALTNIINDDKKLAEKYLHLLSQSLFYRKWAKHYTGLLSKPAWLDNDNEISRYRESMIQSDFFANTNDVNLRALLLNHPENKMAYEYLIASFLLEGNLKGFVRIIQNLKYYGYTRLPVHYEEALIFYNAYNKSNVVPDGFSLSPGTIKRFQDFAATFVRLGNKPGLMEKELEKKHGNTYWYYLHKSKIL